MTLSVLRLTMVLHCQIASLHLAYSVPGFIHVVNTGRFAISLRPTIEMHDAQLSFWSFSFVFSTHSDSFSQPLIGHSYGQKQTDGRPMSTLLSTANPCAALPRAAPSRRAGHTPRPSRTACITVGLRSSPVVAAGVCYGEISCLSTKDTKIIRTPTSS